MEFFVEIFVVGYVGSGTDCTGENLCSWVTVEGRMSPRVWLTTLTVNNKGQAPNSSSTLVDRDNEVR